MLSIYFSRFIFLCISFSLLVAPLPVSAMVEAITTPFSTIEVNIITQNPDISYIYFDKELKKIIMQLSDLDDAHDSLLHELHQHINNGFCVGEYNAVIETVEYAADVLHKSTQLDYAQAEKINNNLDKVINRIMRGEFTVNASNVKNFLNKTIVVESPALVVATSDIGSPPAGLQTIDGVVLATNDRVLLVGQTNQVENGLWLAQSGDWTRPTDFDTGDVPDQAYVLIQSGTVNAGSSWLCTTPTAVIDTDPITFVLFSYPDINLSGDVTGTESATVVSFVGGQTAANVAAATILANAATNLDTDSTIVMRDASGNFSAGTITATLIGTATNFSGSLVGDVIGDQGATVVSFVDGQTASNVAAATVLANAATNLDTDSAIVMRDASGNFAAGIISVTDGVISNSLKVTPFSSAGVVHNNTSGLFSSSLIVNADISSSAAIANNKLATLTTAGLVANASTTANSSNLANAIVARDGSGNFSAGTITGTLSGNATSATTATSATNATNFTGSLIGDVTGTQGATVVSFIDGQSAAVVAAATTLANTATASNTASEIVKRSASGGFSAGVISITDAVISNSLTVTPYSTAGVIHNSTLGLLSSALIVNADISSSAAIANSKLATLTTAGLVANSATTATNLNTASAIVARDSAGNFSAGTISGSFLGHASLDLPLTGGTMTGTLQLPAGTAAAPSLVFTGATTAGLSTSSSGLQFSTNALERMGITSGGTIVIKTFTSPGVVHNDSSGDLSSSLIVNSDIASGAGIINSKLATLTTPGLVANSATTATSSNVDNTIVSRDGSGNFSANEADVVNVVASGNITLSTEPSSSTAGSILKGSNSFIHDFGTNNIFAGLGAGNFTTTGTGQNSGFGSYALIANTSGNNNTAVGYNALDDNTIGNQNTAAGASAMSSNSCGSNNVAMGSNTLISNTMGNNNTAIGYSALESCTTGNNNIVIGANAGPSLTTGSSNIYINADAGSASESNTTRLGTSQTQCFIQGINGTTVASGTTVFINSSGQLGTVSSTRRVKHDIENMGDASEAVLNLSPVTFVYNNDENSTKQYGLIAEEVDKVFPEIVVKNTQGQPETVQYHILPVLLLNEMKKQHATIEQMNDVIASLQEQLNEFIERLKMIENKA